MEGKREAHSWQDLLEQILENFHEKQRIAQQVRVNPITLLRWASKESKPRDDNMRLLLKAIPHDYYQSFAQLITEDFPNLSQEGVMTARVSHTPPSEFYARVLSAYANTPESLYPQVMYDLILQQAIEQLDPDRLGMSVSIVCCMPPSFGTKVRSLREINGMGTPPWKKDLERKTLFLGAESLAGAVVINSRQQMIGSREENPILFSAHWTEHEQSAAAHPIMCKTKIMGCLLAASVRPHAFTEAHLLLLECYANLMALTSKPDDFFNVEDIALRLMPHYTVQEPYFHDFNQRVREKFREASMVHKLITLDEVQKKVLQEIEEELFQLPPHVGE